MLNEKLFNIAEKNNIEITNFPMKCVKSASVQYGDNYYIGMSTTELETDALRNTSLAHELGHCMTGAFYNPHSSLSVMGKAEYKANKWAIKELINKDELENLLQENYRLDEIAEYFSVTEDFIRLAYDFYFIKQVH